MLLRLQHPASWNDFESLCHMLWKEIWQDPNAQKNGRNGQAQNGVDIFGTPLYQEEYEGVQCKDKNAQLGSILTKKELLKECNNATNFLPKISRFTLAASCPNDAILQQEARLMNDEEEFPFKVNIWFWDEIEAEVRTRANLMDVFYKGFPIETDTSVKISATTSKDQFSAFFTRPNLWDNINSKIHISLKMLSYELCDNAYKYGKAKQVKMSFDGKRFQIKDDGIPFNPIAELPNYTVVTLDKYMGSLEFQQFLEMFDAVIEVSHNSTNEFNNVFSIEIKNEFIKPTTTQEFTVNLQNIWGRGAGKKYAQNLKIAEGTEEVILNFDNEAVMSVSAEVIKTMKQQVAKDVNVKVLVGEDSKLIKLNELIDGVDIEKRN
ncbi:hypothetical protein [Thalassotalea sp. PLHSN55]|uniref:hypothetical protein n=1 Tax=Thalassotalea sp. PLHSN55 TaxID=3435888 RepID=UPI003F84D8DA